MQTVLGARGWERDPSAGPRPPEHGLPELPPSVAPPPVPHRPGNPPRCHLLQLVPLVR